MSTDIDIVNLAFDEIGHNSINTFDDGGVPADSAKRVFPVVLRAMLTDTQWNFANRPVSLAADVTAPIMTYSRAFTLPGDWVRVWTIAGNEQAVWEIKEGKILTNETSPLLVEYTFYNDNPTTWAGTFTLACIKFLASFFAMSVAHDPKLAKEKFGEYRVLNNDAKAIDAQQGKARVIVSTSLTTDIRD